MDASPNTSPSASRPPTLPFPILHLGSFDSLALDSFPIPASPTRGSPSSLLVPAAATSPTDTGFRRDTRSDTGPSRQSRLSPDVRPGSDVPQQSSPTPFSVSQDAASYSPAPIQASGPSPVSHPSVSVSPPLAAKPSPSGGKMFALDGPLSAMPFTTRSYSSSSEQSSTAPRTPMPCRPLGPSLTIHIPPLAPSLSAERQFDAASPVLRDSPGIARRRTIVDANPAASRASPVRLVDVVGNMTPPHHVSPRNSDASQQSPTPVKPGSLVMPIAWPTLSVDTSDVSSSARRLEKKPSHEDLKNTSPVSPTAKRSLPRPPSNRTSGPTAESGPPGSLPAPPVLDNAPRNANLPQPPVASSTWPPPGAPRGSFGVLAPTIKANEPLPIPPALPRQHVTPKPQPTNCASSLPVVAGLADSGPYAATTAATPRANQASVGVGRPVASKQLVLQEEVCLECMMRDRDLADVDVQGPGVWSRSSDAGWEELKWREEALLKSMGDESVKSTHTPSLDHSEDTDLDSSSTSPLSTAFSLEEPEVMRRTAAKRQRDASRARRRDTDQKVAKEVGWRGFQWEEGPKGEGLPKGFRGRHGGRLTEEGIKAVMTKFPSASQHRYNTLLAYIQQQSGLIREIKAEAKRLGYYPPPGDVPIPDTSPRRDVSAIPGPRTGSITWDGRHARELSEQMRGAFTSPVQASALSVVRPSPSSPANLANASTPRNAPVSFNRPLTHFYPDREPAALVQRSRALTASAHARHAKGVSIPSILDRSARIGDDNMDEEEDLWSPISPVESGLRPFSFAVRAGAVAGRDGSEGGHGRRSLWGRWGGSVTSLFGGSQGGSGSMMDMHIGLDEDRRNFRGEGQVNSHPRAVSMASPSRPGFFSRNSRSSSVTGRTPTQRDERISTSTSASRLSQALKDEAEDEPTPHKSSGFKGFFRKMKKDRKATNKPNQQPPRVEDSASDLGTPLVPPPPLSYLVGRGERQPNRERSGSSSSMLTSSQSSTAGAKRNSTGNGDLPYNLRSVSAPMAGSSSSGSPSASPTSSRYATTGRWRESYASARNRDRRASGGGLGEFAAEESARIGTTYEVLAGRGLRASPEAASHDEITMLRGTLTSMDNSSSKWSPIALHARPHAASKTASTLSSSSYIETPPPNSNMPFFAHSQASAPAPPSSSPNPPLSPNRFKTLPPLPPLGTEGARKAAAPYAASPDSFATGAELSDQVDFSLPAGYASSPAFERERLQAPLSAGYLSVQAAYSPSLQSASGSPSLGFDPRYRQAQSQSQPQPQRQQPQPQQQSQHQHTAQPRASYDLLADRPRVRNGEVLSPRMAQSMYVQPTAAASTGNFSRPGGKGQMQMYGGGGDGGGGGSGSGGEVDGRSVRGKRGIKGLFSKAGRVM